MSPTPRVSLIHRVALAHRPHDDDRGRHDQRDEENPGDAIAERAVPAHHERPFRRAAHAAMQSERQDRVIDRKEERRGHEHPVDGGQHHDDRGDHRGPDQAKRDRQAAEAGRLRRVDVADADEDERAQHDQDRAVDRSGQAGGEEIEGDDVPVRGKTCEEVIIRLGVRRAEPVGAAQQHEAGDRDAPSGGQHARVIQQQHRQEHEGQVVHDVVEPRAVESRQHLPDAHAVAPGSRRSRR